MLAIRLAKIVAVGAIALYVALVVFNNVTDYWTNFAYVADVLDVEACPCFMRAGLSLWLASGLECGSLPPMLPAPAPSKSL